VKSAIETREAITVDAGGICLRGTYHKLQGQKSCSAPDPDEENCIGVLFVSPGVLPRAGSGDSAVYWADSLAKCGYRSFRFDQPGLGDSDGDLSPDFQSLVDIGAYAPAVSDIVNHLVECFNLRGVVIVGHCAGAVTALYSAAGNGRIQGLILLDPYFHGQPRSEVQKVLTGWQLRIIRKLLVDRPLQSKLSDAGAKLLSSLRNVYRRFRPIRRIVGRNGLPSTANLPLIRCWKQLASTGLPMLVLRSPSSTPKPGEFDYISEFQAVSGRDCRISVRPIEHTTHAFAERHGKEAVRKHSEQWLSACFPLTRCTETRGIEHHSPELADAISGINTNVC